MADSGWFRMISNTRHRAAPKAPEHGIEAYGSTEQAQQQDTATTRSVSDQAHHRHRAQLQTRPLSRLPSWQSLTHGQSQAQAHTNYSCADISGADDDGLVIKEEDCVWQKRSADQMADALLSILMVKPANEPLGPQHCSLALHVLEAYRKRTLKVAELEKELAQEKEGRRRQLDDFEAWASEWTNQATNYEAEIKRLEIIISKQSGTAAVQVARSESLVDRRFRNRSSRSSNLGVQAGTIGPNNPRLFDATVTSSRTQGMRIDHQPSGSTATTGKRPASNKQEGVTHVLFCTAVPHHHKTTSTRESSSSSSGGDNIMGSAGPKFENIGTSKHVVAGKEAVPGEPQLGPPGSIRGSKTHIMIRGRPYDSSPSSSDEESDYLGRNRHQGPRFRSGLGGGALSAASSASTVRIHRRDFSFDAGDDGIEATSETSNQSG